MIDFLNKIWHKIREFHLTDSRGEVDFSGTREVETTETREVKETKYTAKTKRPAETSPLVGSNLEQISGLPSLKGSLPNQGEDVKKEFSTEGGGEGNCTPRVVDGNPDPALSHPHPQDKLYQDSKIGESKIAELCPYCNSKEFIKRGMRKKKLETVQLYECKNPDCGRTFTAQFIKGKKFPLNLIMDGISIYNLGYGFEQTCEFLGQRYGANPGASTLAEWVNEYSPLCRYQRLRSFANRLFSPQNMVEEITMAHRQLYRFRFHRGKMAMILQDWRHQHLGPMRDYLEAVSAETPHQYFQDSYRMSEVKTKFNKAQMIVRAKKNYANRLADFVLQAVKDNKLRHERLQTFMLANDSVTVATEVPVYIRKEDIEHFENKLNFQVGGLEEYKDKNGRVLLTGHIDLIQVRNGLVHILDFKPGAAKVKPIEQLTWYALALSRLTGLRLYEFKCGWFDDKDYFEFYPLHVVKKIQDRKRRKIYLKDRGTSVEVPENNEIKVV